MEEKTKINWLDEYEGKVVILHHRVNYNKSLTLIGTLQILDDKMIKISHPQRGSISIRKDTIDNIILYVEEEKRK